MKFFALVFSLSVAVIVISPTLHAQNSVIPNKQFGIGVGTQGAEFVYAFSPSIQFGSYVGLQLGNGETTIRVTPNLRFIFEGPVNLFLQPGLGFSSSSTVSNGITNSSSSTSFLVDGGLVYYFTTSVGVMGSVRLMDLGMAKGGVSKFGIIGVNLGLEWFFAR